MKSAIDERTSHVWLRKMEDEKGDPRAVCDLIAELRSRELTAMGSSFFIGRGLFLLRILVWSMNLFLVMIERHVHCVPRVGGHVESHRYDNAPSYNMPAMYVASCQDQYHENIGQKSCCKGRTRLNHEQWLAYVWPSRSVRYQCEDVLFVGTCRQSSRWSELDSFPYCTWADSVRMTHLRTSGDMYSGFCF